jgi:hypothetical protein
MIPLSLMLLFAQAAPQTADSIMARVAENQTRAEEARTAVIYHQNVLIRLKRSNGKLAREECTDYTVTPTPDGIKKEQTKFEGKYVDGGKTVAFTQPGFEHKGLDIDADVAKSLVDDLTNAKSKDGIGNDLFLFTKKLQVFYAFHLEGQEDYRGIPVYRITFAPKKFDWDNDAAQWAGEALIDRAEFQPVLITTHLARGIPVLVKTLLGTNIQQFGFKVTYRKVDDGLWFPATYGGEFKVRVLFVWARRIGISMQNSDFQRAKVESRVKYDPIE